jgi:hypothetical protein
VSYSAKVYLSVLACIQHSYQCILPPLWSVRVGSTETDYHALLAIITDDIADIYRVHCPPVEVDDSAQAVLNAREQEIFGREPYASMGRVTLQVRELQIS